MRSQIGQTFSGVRGSNCTKLAEETEGSCPSLKFVSDFRYRAAVSNAGRSKSSDVEQVAQLSQRKRAAAWVSFGWVVVDGVGQ